jgi:hypothetical protein
MSEKEQLEEAEEEQKNGKTFVDTTHWKLV